jgi:ribosomal 50S subunit-associated protein YjgA (DUF615 family)
MLMTGLTREAIERILGPVDAATASEIATTGATETELAEAHAWLANDEALVNEFKPFPSARVQRLIELLRSMELSDDDRL